MSAPRHLRLAEQLVAVLGIHSDEVPSQTLERVAERLAQYEQTVEANAVVYLHADRLTVEPTTFSEDGHLRPLLADGEVALALRPFPSGDGAVVLYGTPAQIEETCSAGIVPFLADLVEDET